MTVKVKKKEPVNKVKNREGKELKKQDCVVGDASGCTCVVVWERDVNRLKKTAVIRLSKGSG